MLGSRLKKKIHNEKGFTLAELLVVIAILAILVAISIPIFTSRLDAAKESTDESNIRAAKALVSSAILEGNASATYYYNAEKGILVESKDKAGDAYGQSSKTVKNSTGTPQGNVLKIEVNGEEMTFSWE